MSITIAEVLPPRTHLAHEAMRELRPNVGAADEFAALVDEVQRPDGYRILGAFTPGREEAIAVAGFRISHNLAWGRFLYVDDLSTAPSWRGRGAASQLLDHICEEARREGCAAVHLDSGVGAHRWTAHRLYHRHGFSIASHHFELELTP